MADPYENSKPGEAWNSAYPFVPSKTTQEKDREIATLRARVEELERENRELRTQDDPAFTHAFKLRAEAAEARLSEVTRLAVKALEPFVAAFDKRRSAYIRRYSDPAIGRTNFDKMPDKWPMEKIEFSMGALRRARTALDRLNAMKGESDG